MGFNINIDLAGAKDKSLSKLLLSTARQYLREYGEVLDLALDSAARSISVEVLPVGEKESFRATVFGYGLATDGSGRGYLTFEDVAFSRQWLTLLAARLLPSILSGRRPRILAPEPSLLLSLPCSPLAAPGPGPGVRFAQNPPVRPRGAPIRTSTARRLHVSVVMA